MKTQRPSMHPTIPTAWYRAKPTLDLLRSNEWVYGSGYHLDEIKDPGYRNSYLIDFPFKAKAIKEETLGMYIHRLDRLGTMIYTGDVIVVDVYQVSKRSKEIRLEKTFKAVVHWDPKRSQFGFVIYSPKGYSGIRGFDMFDGDEEIKSSIKTVVIGNIIDNPDYKAIL